MNSAETSNLQDLLSPLKFDRDHSAILLDVDGTLAPIVQFADDAHVPETTRRPLIDVANSYGVVACVSGRRASDARRIVSLGSIAYLGSHGAEILRPGAISPEVNTELQSWRGRVQEFVQRAYDEELHRLRIRLEDKDVIGALHWRGAPDEDEAEKAVQKVAQAAKEAGLATHWGRKVLEIRPPVSFNKGCGIVALLNDLDIDNAIYVGDDTTDIDAFRGLDNLLASGGLQVGIKVAVRSDEGPTDLEEQANIVVEGTIGVRNLLLALL